MIIASSSTVSDHSTVTAASAQFATMVLGATYRLVSSTDAYIAFGANPTASAADNNHLVVAGFPVEIRATGADLKVAIIRVTADGVATLTRIA